MRSENITGLDRLKGLLEGEHVEFLPRVVQLEGQWVLVLVHYNH